MRRKSVIFNSLIGAAALLTSVLVGTSTSQAVADGPLAAYDAAHAGGTLTLVAQAAAGTLDPKVNYTGQYWQIFQATYDGLLSFSYGTGKTTLAELVASTTQRGFERLSAVTAGVKDIREVKYYQYI